LYYRLDEDIADANVYLTLDSDEYISFISGHALAVVPEAPLPFVMEVDADEDGTPMTPVMPAYFSESSLMHENLVAALRAAGVDNLQLLPAVIRNPETGQQHTDYVVVNVIGLVSCANIDESRTEPLADVHYFHDLVIDPTRVGDLLLFRLAESQMEIIVHERVAEAIRAGGFAGVTLDALAERTA
jgi:hypothetical protein